MFEQEVIDYLRAKTAGTLHSNGLSPPCARQIIEAIRIITDTPLGAQKIKSLHENADYFRRQLNNMGCLVCLLSCSCTHSHAQEEQNRKKKQKKIKTNKQQKSLLDRQYGFD